MKKTITALGIALCCGTVAYAQTPGAMPAQEKDPNAVPSAPADKAQMRTDERTGATPQGSSAMGASGERGHGMGMMKGIDANGDGVISKEEWDAHHAKMWNRMSKNGSIAVQDMQKAMEEGGPN